MNVWVSKHYDGTVFVSRFRPRRDRAVGASHDELYVVPGDPLGEHPLRPTLARELLRPIVVDVEPLSSVYIEITTGLARQDGRKASSPVSPADAVAVEEAS